MALHVVFEDEFLLVLDKPAGLVVHPAPGHWDDTLVNALAARGVEGAKDQADRRIAGQPDGNDGDTDGEQEVEADGESLSGYPTIRPSDSLRPSDPLRPGIVHRLDKDTSGLMVVAKTETAHRKLSHALGLRRIEREYAALTWGHLDSPQEIDAPIGRNPKNRQQMAVVKGGRDARTLVTPIARFAMCDLLRVKLYSGRTHQIRVHLAHVGHPVVGDPLYGGGGHKRMTGHDRNEALALERETPRQALHAASLRFAHPETREWLEFYSDWPDDLRPALAAAASDPNLLARPKVLEYLGFRA
jgi:23S rRNA pseudouridine1911/1915/1917 synthase